VTAWSPEDRNEDQEEKIWCLKCGKQRNSEEIALVHSVTSEYNHTNAEGALKRNEWRPVN